MFGINDFFIIGFILLLSLFFSRLARKIFFSYSFPKEFIKTSFQSKGLEFKTFKEVSKREIPVSISFHNEPFRYNSFLFKIVFFEIDVYSLKDKEFEKVYIKYYKAGVSLFLKDKICTDKYGVFYF